MQIPELYEPMLARDIEAIPSATGKFRRDHSAEKLFRAVSRFALLAASPSQHGKHALLACVAAGEIQALLGRRYPELLTECAIYASQSRLPWSEPPITDPPAVEERHPISLDEIRAAIASRDRLRGERWLAARLRKGSIASDFFTIASEDLSDFGHKLIVAVGVWKLALMHGQPESYPFLRVAIDEWTAYGGESAGSPVPGAESIPVLVDQLVAEQGSVEAFHRLVLCDAAIEASRPVREPSQLHRSSLLAPRSFEPPIYRLARDYAEYLKAFAISTRYPEHQDRILSAAKYNRDHAPSFEDWSFA